MKKSFVMLLSVVLINSTGFTQGSYNTNKIDSNFHLYILAGQSNMSGRGEITEEYKNESNPRVFMLDKNNQWVVAHHPLHFDKSVAGVGPGLAFAIKMANENPGIKIGLVPCAVGGTAIRVWQPGAYDSATKKHPYDDAVARIKEAMKSGVIKGMLWHQGEADSRPEAAAIYIPQLKTLIERIRTLTGNASLPVVAGELGRYRQQLQINAELKKLPSMVPNTAVASSEGLTDKGDGSHFSSPSAEKLGERYAEQMKRLESNH
jgi:hypothetical protein